MAQDMSNGSADQQLVEVVQAVTEPLWKGLNSFHSVTEILLEVKADIVLSENQMFLKIREEIVKMQDQIEKSEQIAKDELLKLDKASEALTVEQSSLTNQKNQKVSELQALNTQMNSHMTNLKSYENDLQNQERHLREANDTLNSQRQRKAEAEARRNAGIGLLFIPFVGWIVGATMITVSQVEMDQASNAVRSAQDEVNTCRSRVSSFQNKVSECKAQINRVQSDISATDRQIEQAKGGLRDMSKKREDVAQVQDQMRKAVSQLGQLSAAGDAAELQTRLMIVMEPLVAVLEEVTNALGRIAGNQLLHREGIHSLMWKLKTNQTKLKELFSSGANEYY